MVHGAAVAVSFQKANVSCVARAHGGDKPEPAIVLPASSVQKANLGVKPGLPMMLSTYVVFIVLAMSDSPVMSFYIRKHDSLL